MRNDFWLVDSGTYRAVGTRAMRNCSVRCPPRPISIMRRNVAADTTARAEEGKKLAIVLSRLRRRLSHFSSIFSSLFASRHRNAFARDFPRDYPVLLRRLLDVLVRDSGFKSTIFQRDVWRITHVFVRAYVYMRSVKSTFRAAP